MAGKTRTPIHSGISNSYLLALYMHGTPMGNVFFVHSTRGTNSSGYGFTPDAPVASIDYAIGLTTADNDDWIVVLPGHTETITGAAGVGLDVAGVTIVGLGKGRQRGKVNYTTAVGASFDVTAARCRVENLVFTPTGFDAITAAINVQAADFSLIGCELELANATNQAVLGILTTAAADRMLIQGCHIHGTTDAGTATAIRIVGGTDAQIIDNTIVGAYTTTLGGIDQNTTAAVNTIVNGNRISNQTASSAKAMVFSSSSTPIITNNRLTILSGTAPITAAAGFVGGNTYAAAAGVTAAAAI